DARPIPPLREPQRACMRATAALRRLLASRSAPVALSDTVPPPAGGETLPVMHGQLPLRLLRRTLGAHCAPLRGQTTRFLPVRYVHKKQERPDFRPAAPAIKGRIESRKQEHVGGSYA